MTDEITLRATRGPQADWFDESTIRGFFETEFVVGDEVNRLGARLGSAKFPASRRHELVSEGIADGAIQIAADGTPMILFCEQRTTGGYPKIANVVRADLSLVGQLRPGTRVRFREFSLGEAWEANRNFEVALQSAVHEF